MPVMGRVWLLVFLLVMMFTAGCGDGRPNRNFEFFPVKGRVLVDGQPMQGGIIEFSPINDPDIIALGKIKEDGLFTLASNVAHPNRENVPGVPPGEYHVSVRMPSAPGKGAPPSLALTETKTVRAGDNEFTIEVSAVSDTSPAPETAKKNLTPEVVAKKSAGPEGPTAGPRVPSPSVTRVSPADDGYVDFVAWLCRAVAALVVAAVVIGAASLMFGAASSPQQPQSEQAVAKDLWTKVAMLFFGIVCSAALLAIAEIMLMLRQVR